MAVWNNNNLACLKTWIHLRVLDQHYKSFPEAGSIKMDELTFWNQAASQELREIAGKTICFQLDNMFRLWDKAKYEANSNFEKAIDSMYNKLIDENITMSDLAEEVDNNYKFRGETIDEALA